MRWWSTKQHLVVRAACGLILAALSGCSSTGYFTDRARDASDIFTLTLGVGGGIKGQVGPVHLGFLFEQDKVGFRNGLWLPDRLRAYGGKHNCEREADFDLFLLGMPGAACPFGGNFSRVRTSTPPDLQVWTAAVGNYPLVYGPYVGPHAPLAYGPDVTSEDEPLPASVRAKCLTQIELVGGIGGTARVGLNVADFVDFLLGWTGADILNDDVTSEQMALHQAKLKERKDVQNAYESKLKEVEERIKQIHIGMKRRDVEKIFPTRNGGTQGVMADWRENPTPHYVTEYYEPPEVMIRIIYDDTGSHLSPDNVVTSPPEIFRSELDTSPSRWP